MSACITSMLGDGGDGARKSRGTSPGLLGGGRKGREERMRGTGAGTEAEKRIGRGSGGLHGACRVAGWEQCEE